jgi:hypothetical protein
VQRLRHDEELPRQTVSRGTGAMACAEMLVLEEQSKPF